MNHLLDHIYSWSYLINWNGKDSKGKNGAAWLCFPPWNWVCSSILLRVPGMVAVPRVAWSWKQELLHVPQAVPFPCIASSTLYCCQTMIFYGRHLNFTFWFCSENECLEARTENNRFWLPVAEKLDYEHKWAMCQFLHWCTCKYIIWLEPAFADDFTFSYSPRSSCSLSEGFGM